MSLKGISNMNLSFFREIGLMRKIWRKYKIALAHAVVPYKRWFWEVRHSAPTLLPRAYFSITAHAVGA